MSIIAKIILPLLFLCPIKAEEFNPVKLASKIVKKEQDWKKHCKKFWADYQTWIDDNPNGNVKQFLDDRLLQKVKIPTTVKELKTLIFWLALYGEAKEECPRYVYTNLKTYSKKILKLCGNWSWEEALKSIKEEISSKKE